MNQPVITVRDVCKKFTLHQQGGVEINAVSHVSFTIGAGECVALHGPSGAGKSTMLRTLYGNYLPTSGEVLLHCGTEDIAGEQSGTCCGAEDIPWACCPGENPDTCCPEDNRDGLCCCDSVENGLEDSGCCGGKKHRTGNSGCCDSWEDRAEQPGSPCCAAGSECCCNGTQPDSEKFPGTALPPCCPSGETVDISRADPRLVLRLRRDCISYVSQFLRVIPRVSTLDLVAEPLLETGVPAEEALESARKMLCRLNLPERLWSLAPATFSGGEQQRVNIARGFIRETPVLLLDEPTASLDGRNREIVIELILAAKQRGAAVAGIFHDDIARERVADRCIEMLRP